MKKLFLCTVIAVLMAFVLTACGTEADAPPADEPAAETSEQATDTAPAQETAPEATVEDVAAAHADTASPLEAMDAVLAMFPMYVDTGESHVEGTVLNYVIGSETPWSGLFGGGIFSTSTIEASIQGIFGGGESIFSTNELFQMGQEGIATWSYDLDERTITINQEFDVYWHDGVPLTLDDLVYAFYVIADPEYTGIRFSTGTRMVVGIEDYNSGAADHIEGLVLSNDNRTLTIHFTEMSPSLLYSFGFWSAPMPRHIFEGIPIAEMPESDAVLTNPIGWGPFIVDNIVPGEAVHFVRNENYVWGTPLVEEILVTRMTAELIPTALESGNADIAEMSPLFFGDHQNPTNFRYLSQLIGDYSYVAFRLGHWDFDENKNIYDPNRKMANVNLRRAMAFAIDESVLANSLFHGLRFPAVTNTPAHHRALLDLTVPGFPYNPQMAMELLDEAGFIDIDGDGLREDPDGEQFTVIFAYPTGPEEEIIVAFYVQSWAAVGIRVELWQGRTHDIFYLWDTLDFDADDEEIDIYMGSWSPGADPNPGGSWGHAMWNPSRYTSPEYDAILDRMLTPAAFDEAYMLQAFSEWQWYWYNNAPYFPTQQRIGLWAINNRVTSWDNRLGISPRTSGWHTIGLSAAEPYSR